MRKVLRYFLVPTFCIGVIAGEVHAVGAPANISTSSTSMVMGAETREATTPMTFQHGNVSWLPELATQAGWPKKTHKKLAKIILRESGGCPNRKGGDKVDKDCNITGVSEWNHRSDTGLLQINGVHWKKDHPQYAGLLCKRMAICSQEPLLDPLVNLMAGKLLFDVAGWSPWFTN